jgi:hypothetical protein
MNLSDRFRLNCEGDLISYTQGESVPRGLTMFIAGLILAGLVIMAPAIWPQTKKTPVASKATSYATKKSVLPNKVTDHAPQGEQMGSWVHGPQFPRLD